MTASEAELISKIASTRSTRIVGLNTKKDLLPSTESTVLFTSDLQGIVEWQPQDLVITVRAGTSLTDLLTVLATKDQCLPIPILSEFDPIICGLPGSLGGGVAMNLPIAGSDLWGTWRDWVIGMKVLLADGTVAKCGSKVVKSVAGYDAHKLFIGSRGTLGAILEITVRTYPLTCVPKPNLARLGPTLNRPWWIQRVRRTDFPAAVLSAKEFAGIVDPVTQTLWLQPEPNQIPKRFPHDWVIFKFEPFKLSEIQGRAKSVFDPHGLLWKGGFAP